MRRPEGRVRCEVRPQELLAFKHTAEFALGQLSGFTVEFTCGQLVLIKLTLTTWTGGLKRFLYVFRIKILLLIEA